MAVDEPGREWLEGIVASADEDLKMSSGKVAVFPGPDGRSLSGSRLALKAWQSPAVTCRARMPAAGAAPRVGR